MRMAMISVACWVGNCETRYLSPPGAMSGSGRAQFPSERPKRGTKGSTARLSGRLGSAINQNLSLKACSLPGSQPPGYHRKEIQLEQPATAGFRLCRARVG